MAGAGGHERKGEELGGAEREAGDEERARSLAEDGRPGGAEGPGTVPGVVAPGGDEERNRRGGEVVEAGGEQPRVDGEVDGVAGGANKAEAQELALEEPTCH